MRRGDAHTIVGTYLLYLLFIYVGLMGLFTAYYHVFRPIQASASIGWAPSPYEFEVGMADLTVGVLGVLCLVFRDNFWRRPRSLTRCGLSATRLDTFGR